MLLERRGFQDLGGILAFGLLFRVRKLLSFRWHEGACTISEVRVGDVFLSHF